MTIRISEGLRIAQTTICLVLFSGLTACASFNPQPSQSVVDGFSPRIQTGSDGAVEVAAVPLTATESQAIFGVALAKKGIQPVWISINNQEAEDYWLLTHVLDPDYFSAREAAWAVGAGRKPEIEEHFSGFELPVHIPAGNKAEGYVFTNVDQHAKAVSVSLVGEAEYRNVDFVFSMPAKAGLDWHDVDFETLYEKIEDLSEPELLAELEGLPCCVMSTDGKRSGDPVNLVFIGSDEQLYTTLVQAGWHETQALTTSSAIKTGVKGTFGGTYKHSPISPLLLFDRPQDAGFQMARSNIHQRNHMRVWLSPWRFEGQPVWLGQISRDIGVRFTRYSAYLTTHKIDPDIDESRYALIQQLLLGQRVSAFGYAGGSMQATPDNPGFNTTMDPMWSDGRRAIFKLTDEPVGLDEIEFFGLLESTQDK